MYTCLCYRYCIVYLHANNLQYAVKNVRCVSTYLPSLASNILIRKLSTFLLLNICIFSTFFVSLAVFIFKFTNFKTSYWPAYVFQKQIYVVM